MRIKIFVPNSRGKIELTKEELERLLNESYQQGWNDKPSYGYYYNHPYCCSSDGTSNFELADISLTSTCGNKCATINSCNDTIAGAITEVKETMENAYKVELK